MLPNKNNTNWALLVGQYWILRKDKSISIVTELERKILINEILTFNYKKNKNII